MKRRNFDLIYKSISSSKRIEGLTHTFYRYPARFSPEFARETILALTEPGDLVLDPFMGGGTTLVEATSLGRNSIGFDINPLACFVSEVKTTVLRKSEKQLVIDWIKEVARFKIGQKSAVSSKWLDEGYYKNLEDAETWRIKRFLELALDSLNEIDNQRVSNFIRCIILNTAQWGLDGRKNIPTISQFRARFQISAKSMLDGMEAYTTAVNQSRGELRPEAKPICGSAANLIFPKKYQQAYPKLILMSPPYPGIHVLYHRWQIKGRKETPAPYWIADCYDGHGEGHYTMGGRKTANADYYFETMRNVYDSLLAVSSKDTLVVQLVGFSNPRSQLPKYLEILADAGFSQVSITKSTKNQVLNRNVPNRKWYTQSSSPGAREYLLIHKPSK